MTLDVETHFRSIEGQSLDQRGVSAMARDLIASEILAIAAEIRALVRQGRSDIINLTVGDFSSKEFPIPPKLASGVAKAIEAGHTNYPPSNGVPELRDAVQAFYAERLGLKYPVDSILIASGARPMIAGIFYALINPGDRVVYGVPSWNNNHYCTLTGAVRVEVPASPQNGFFPRAKDLVPHLPGARLLCLCTPQNPTGTVIDAGELRAISDAVWAENERRRATGEKPLYLMFDQVYWMLTFREAKHTHPLAFRPELAPYVIFVDAISKSFAATGLRVGWAVGPKDIMARMAAILTHVGAWAPRPEQVATAGFLSDRAAVDGYREQILRGVSARLDRLATGFEKLRAEGHDVETMAPQGAIYLSVRVGVAGKKTAKGDTLKTDEDVRKFLLAEAGVALVPFNAFGVREDTGWYRASVGAITLDEATAAVERIGAALRTLKG